MTTSKDMFMEQREADMYPEIEMKEQELQLSPIQKLALFETNRADRKAFAEDLLTRIDNGEIEPLKVHVQVKAMEDLITILTDGNEKTNKNAAIAKRYKGYVNDAAAQHGKKFQLYNAEFESKEVGVKYDYSKCADPFMADLLERQAVLDKQVKDREAFLKTVPAKGLAIVIESTGEVVTVYPPAKSSTSSVSVSLK